jgi:hypothetical protein
MTINLFIPMWIVHTFEVLMALYFVAWLFNAVCRVILWYMRRDGISSLFGRSK